MGKRKKKNAKNRSFRKNLNEQNKQKSKKFRKKGKKNTHLQMVTHTLKKKKTKNSKPAKQQVNFDDPKHAGLFLTKKTKTFLENWFKLNVDEKAGEIVDFFHIRKFLTSKQIQLLPMGTFIQIELTGFGIFNNIRYVEIKLKNRSVISLCRKHSTLLVPLFNSNESIVYPDDKTKKILTIPIFAPEFQFQVVLCIGKKYFFHNPDFRANVPTRDALPLQIVREMSPSLLEWKTLVKDEQNRCFSSYLPCPFISDIPNLWYSTVVTNAPWVKIFVGGVTLPRKVCWFVDSDCRCEYGYGQQITMPVQTPKWLKCIEEMVFSSLGIQERPNCCNLNLYENGQSSVGWHADNEDLFQSKDQDSLIVSLSLGGTRKFQLKHKTNGSIITQKLSNGDICTMEGRFQKFYLHQIPKENDAWEPRINITWRTIVKHSKLNKCPIARCDQYKIYSKCKIATGITYGVKQRRKRRKQPHLIVFIEKPMPIIPLALNKTNTLKIDLDNLDSDDEKMEEEEEGIKKAKNFNLEKMDSLTFEQEMAERMKSM